MKGQPGQLMTECSRAIALCTKPLDPSALGAQGCPPLLRFSDVYFAFDCHFCNSLAVLIILDFLPQLIVFLFQVIVCDLKGTIFEAPALRVSCQLFERLDAEPKLKCKGIVVAFEDEGFVGKLSNRSITLV